MARSSTCRYVLTASVGSAAATGETVSATSRMSTRTNTPTTSAPTPAKEAVKRWTDVPVEIASSTSSTRRPAHICPSDRWFVDLVTAIPRLADERERQLCDQRYRRGQRHPGGLRANNDLDADVWGEPSAPRPEIPEQLGIGVGALHRERMDRSSGVIPAAGAGSDEPGSRREASGEQVVRTRY